MPTLRLRAVLATGIASLLAAQASAVTYTYTGPGAGTSTAPTTGNFNVADSWVGEIVPTFDRASDLVFNNTTGSTTALTATNNLGTIELNSLSVTNNKAQITLTGGTLSFFQDPTTLEAPTLASLSGSTQVLAVNSALILNTNMTMTNNGTGQIQIGNSTTAGAGNIDLGGNILTLTNVSGASAYQFGAGSGSNRGVISGTGSIVQTMGNTGSTTAFFGASTFSGGYTLNSGILVIGINSSGTAGAVTDGAIGTGTLTINGGTVRATNTGSRTLLNDVTVAGNFSIGDATTTGVNLGGNITLTGNRTITSTAGGTATNFTDRHTISGVIGESGGSFGLTKTGAGTLVLSGANTYTGTTALTNGALLVAANVPSGAASPLGNSTSAISIGGAGTAAANAISFYVGVPGSTPGASTVTVARDITVANGNSTGSTAIGTVSDTDAVFSGNLALSRQVFLASASTGPRAATFSGIISGGQSIVKTNAGQVRLSGVNTYTGTTTLRTGTLLVGGNALVSTAGVLGNASSAIIVGDANSAATDNLTLAIDGAFQIARSINVNANNTTGLTALTARNLAGTTATYSGVITLGRNVILGNDTANATTLFSGNMTDGASSFGVTINGPGIVEFGGAGVNTYDGGTTVASGVLKLNRNFGGNSTLTGAVSISGGTLLLGGNEQLSDNLVLNMSGGVLDAANFTETILDLNYTGGTILNGGNLIITGSQDRFLFDGTTVSAPETINRHILYLGSTTSAVVNNTLALDNDASHDLSTNDGAAAVDVIFNAAITNDGSNTPTSLVKKGNGTVLFNVANTFGGAGKTLELQGGVVSVNADNQLGHAANTVTLNGGTLLITNAFATTRTFVAGATAGSIEVASGQSQVIGALSGSGTFNKTGAGELLITGDQSASFSGSTSVNAGTLTISALNNVLGNAANDLTLNGGTLKVTGGLTVDAGKTITVGPNGGTLQVQPSLVVNLAAAGNLAGGGVLTKTGNGKLLISEANAGITTGAGLVLAAGDLELTNAQALGNTVKSAITLTGGLLTLTNDAATTFGNAITAPNGASVLANVQTPGALGVTHTMGALSTGTGTFQVSAGANVTGGTPGLTFTGTTLTGNSTFATDAGVQLTTGTVALGANKLIVTGDGTTNLSGVISGGPGAGLVALEKSGPGLATTGTAAGTFTGNVVVNNGVLRVQGATALGNAANVIRLNGGSLQLASAATSYAVEFNGGTIQSTGATREWSGVTSTTPSITFLTDTTFNLDDPLAPGTARDLNFGLDAGNGGVTASSVPVNLVVNAPASNATSANKLRFRQSAVAGSVTGTLTVNQNAIVQIRGVGAVNGFGSGTEVRLNTGFNASTPLSTGRFEFVSNVDTNFGNNIVVLADSAIGVGRIATGNNNKVMTAGTLTIGNHTLSTVDVSGDSNDRLVFSGTTTLTGSPTFFTQSADLTLNGIAETGGPFTVTKTGTKSLTINGPGAWAGETNVNAGSLVLGNSFVLDTGNLNVAGTLASGATSQVLGQVLINGAGTWTSTAGGQITASSITFGSTASSTINAVLAGSGGLTKGGTGTVVLNAQNTFTGDLIVNAGTLNLGVDHALADTAKVTVTGGALNFANGGSSSRNETITDLIVTGGTVRTTSGTITIPTQINITGHLDVTGGDLAVNSGSIVNAHKVSFSNVANVHVIGGNSAVQVNELIVGSGGLEFTGSNLRMNLGAASGMGSRLRLNGDVHSFASFSESGVFGTSAAGDAQGVREIVIGDGTRIFTVEDGGVFNDLRLDFPLVGNGSLVKTGPGQLAIAAASTFAGNTIIDEGTIRVEATASLASPVIEIGSNGTLDTLPQLAGYNVGVGKVVRNNGLVTGKLNLSGTLTGDGAVLGNVNVGAGGIVAPGAATGTLNVEGFLTFGNDSILALQLGGVLPGDGSGFYDQLNMTNSFSGVSMGNNVSLQLSLTGGFVPSAADIFYVFSRADFVEFGLGTFAGAAEGATVNLGGGFTGTITYLADWTGVQAGSTLTGGNDVAIYNVVPEPASAMLLLGGLALVTAQRRRRPAR